MIEQDELMKKIVSLAKRRGFVFPSSEIYGGFQSIYDYGPLGVLLKNNLKSAWWKSMVQERYDVVGLDGAIFTHPKVWSASGHVEAFADPLVDCKQCKKRHRADHLIEAQAKEDMAGVSTEDLTKKIQEMKLKCPECEGELTEARTFNLLVKAYLGVTEDAKSAAYLRGETCQTIYLNFHNVLQSTNKKLPLGIAQIGKAFRNEITPGNFIFRMREFEQMEMQYFVKPGASSKYFKEWKDARMKWVLEEAGLQEKNVRWRQHNENERAHYAKDAWDIEYKFPFGFKEIEGVHDRGDWDLSRHQKYSGNDLEYRDPETNEKYIPHIVETSIGADRLALTALIDAYNEELVPTADEGKTETRVVMKFHKNIAPIKVAVLPLSKKETLTPKAKEVYGMLKSDFMAEYDETQSIGKRYRRQDEIGTPYCVTVDFETLEDNSVTVRDRDTMKQDRINIEELKAYLEEKF